MSETISCRLCLEICNDFLLLYEQDGENNTEVYEVASKFFHPMFLTISTDSQQTAVCSTCWTTISDFYAYQQSVLLIQDKLVNVEKVGGILIVKNENDELPLDEACVEDDETLLVDAAIEEPTLNPAENYSSTNFKTENLQSEEITLNLPDTSKMEMHFKKAIIKKETKASANLANCPDFIKPSQCLKTENQSSQNTEIKKLEEASVNVSTQNTSQILNDNEEIEEDDEEDHEFIALNDLELENSYNFTNDKSLFLKSVAASLERDEDSIEIYSSDDECSENSYASLILDNDDEYETLDGDTNASQEIEPMNISQSPSVAIEISSDEEMSLGETPAKKKIVSTISSSNKPKSAVDAVVQRMLASKSDIIKQQDESIAKWQQHFDCSICQQRLSSFSLVEQHFKDSHPLEKCYVECCQRKFFNHTQLEIHAQIHLEPDDFKCALCVDTFSTRSSHNIHMKRKHGIASKGRPKIHASKETDDIIAKWRPHLECPICKESHHNYTLLKKHMQVQHPNDMFHILCCGRKLNSRWKIAAHANTHLNPTDKFQCSLCHFMASNVSLLKEHLKRDHRQRSNVVMTNPMRHPCTECSQEFRFRFRLMEHRTAHSGKHAFKCRFCSETFRFRKGIYAHAKKDHRNEWNSRTTNRASLMVYLEQ